MKRFGLVVLVVSMVLVVFGCGKKSGLEGKVVDEKGVPVANVKIIAKQVQPIKGYEQFEATTGSDGSFSFKKLFPTSEYILFPWYEDWEEAPMRTLRYETNKLVARFNKEGWTTERKMKVQSGPEGQTTLLTSPMVIQPCISTVTGKLVGGREKPLKNIKIIAKQVNPIPGYERLEATTGSDGSFSFKKLFPTSEYILLPWYEDWEEAPMRTLRYETNKLVARFNKEGWTTERKMKVQSGPEGQTTLLTSPMVIQPCISTVTGKLVGGREKPLKNIKIIAKQVNPIPGYERLEATTGSDGSFSFKKLFPTSEYILLPWYEDWEEAPMRTLRYETNKLVARFNKEGWTTERKMKVQSGPEGQTTLLTSPMVIQPCISTVTGKLVGGREKPLKNIKIIAKQVNPIPGYERLEATTGSDGSFSIKKLFPNSKYLFIPNSKNWKTDATWTLNTKGEQELIALKSPLTIRFTAANEVVTDTSTGLQWAAKDNGRNINWHNARAYCRNYRGGGHTDWRLPTVSELKGLYRAGIRYNKGDIINITASSPWSSETLGSKAANVGFSGGDRYWDYQKFTFRHQALPVRSGK